MMIHVVTKGDWKEHVQSIETVLDIMGAAGLKVNAEKSFFGQKELDYLGYHISQEGIRPDSKKVHVEANNISGHKCLARREKNPSHKNSTHGGDLYPLAATNMERNRHANLNISSSYM